MMKTRLRRYMRLITNGCVGGRRMMTLNKDDKFFICIVVAFVIAMFMVVIKG